MLNPFGQSRRAPDLGGGAVAISAGKYEGAALSLSPASPSDPKAVVLATNQISLSWRDNSIGEKGFQIERAVADIPHPPVWTQIAVVGPNKTNYTDKTVSEGIVYVYRIRAYNVYGTSPYCQALPVITAPLIAPQSPRATPGTT